jgi:hypothetical protein
VEAEVIVSVGMAGLGPNVDARHKAGHDEFLLVKR